VLGKGGSIQLDDGTHGVVGLGGDVHAVILPETAADGISDVIPTAVVEIRDT
jgi:hypothetical protein